MAETPRDRIRDLRKRSKKGAILDICRREASWEPVPERLSTVRTSETKDGGGLIRTTCLYDEDVPLICAAPRLFDLVEDFLIGPPKGTSTQEVIEEMENVIVSVREMALERWENQTSGLTSARKMLKVSNPKRTLPRTLKAGELAPKLVGNQDKLINVLDEIGKLKEDL